MTLPFQPPFQPMLAKVRAGIPEGDDWLYEPKWDGFRAIVYRDGDDLLIVSRNGQPLERYFPELIPIFKRSLPQRAIVDGEIVIAAEKGLDFDALLQRIHPAASRVNMLAETTPSSFIAFDLLAEGDMDFRDRPLSERRKQLKEVLKPERQCFLTPQTTDAKVAAEWFEEFEGAGLDGIIAKQSHLLYQPGERVMFKIKHERTADCVVGGYRLSKQGDSVGSLLLGLYDSDGVLHFAGHTSAFKTSDRKEVLAKLKPLEGASFGAGRTPGGPSRWNQGRDLSWIEVKPELVCEVAFDHLQGDRFRHGTRIIKWRPDKDPRECTYDQLEPPKSFSLDDIRKLSEAT